MTSKRCSMTTVKTGVVWQICQSCIKHCNTIDPCLAHVCAPDICRGLLQGHGRGTELSRNRENIKVSTSINVFVAKINYFSPNLANTVFLVTVHTVSPHTANLEFVSLPLGQVALHSCTENPNYKHMHCIQITSTCKSEYLYYLDVRIYTYIHSKARARRR